MKKIKAETGGRPFNNDDITTLQHELSDAAQAHLLGQGAFIVSGCQVTGTGPAYTVAAGILCLDGQLLRFAGAGAVALPAQFQAGANAGSDPRPYQTGGTKNCMEERPAVLGADNPAFSGEFVRLTGRGGLTWAHVQEARFRRVGEVQYRTQLTSADYDATGLGVPYGPAWGWGLVQRAVRHGRFARPVRGGP